MPVQLSGSWLHGGLAYIIEYYIIWHDGLACNHSYLHNCHAVKYKKCTTIRMTENMDYFIENTLTIINNCVLKIINISLL